MCGLALQPDSNKTSSKMFLSMWMGTYQYVINVYFGSGLIKYYFILTSDCILMKMALNINDYFPSISI